MKMMVQAFVLTVTNIVKSLRKNAREYGNGSRHSICNYINFIGDSDMSITIYLEVVSDLHKHFGHNPYSEKLSPEKYTMYNKYKAKIIGEYNERRVTAREAFNKRSAA